MEKKNVVTVDPELWMKRQLHYQERQSGWRIFQTIYWAIYIFVFSIILLYAGYRSLAINTTLLFGDALFVFSIMLIIYGFAAALHFKLLKRYG